MTAMYPRVSVIIPVYNGAAFVVKAIESVFNQTYRSYEIIVADDGSTDSTLDVLQNFGNRITVLELPHRGISTTRNKAINSSHGEFIALLDSDDIWESEKLELQVTFLDSHPDYALVYSYHTNFTDNNEDSVAQVKKLDLQGYVFKNLLTKTASPANSTIMVRRHVFNEAGGYNETLTALEDYELNLRIARKYKIGRIPQSLLRRRIHKDSFYSSGYDNRYIYHLPVYDKLLSDPEVERIIEQQRDEFMSNFILKFIFKSLFDGRSECIDQKLKDLKKYSLKKAERARTLVESNDTSSESWAPFIPDFDIWRADVKQKAELYKVFHNL
jgi:glycosyltransferase involved in cell wall biosynthesis